LKIPDLNKRLDELSAKLGDEPKERVGKFDPTSFTEAEMVLFRKIDELLQKYNGHLPSEILQANKDLICKGSDILLKYSIGTFRIALLCMFGDPESKRDQSLVSLFLYNFLIELMECLKDAHKQPLNEEEFQRLFERYDLFNKISRVARRSGLDVKMQKRADDLEKAEYSEEIDNEHYDRV
jgi:hypothetical protein